MSRTKISEDLRHRLQAFQRTRGLHWRELGEILNVDTSNGIGWVYVDDVPDYVVDMIERLVAPVSVEISSMASIVADVAVRYGIAERVEDLPHGTGVVLHVGSVVTGWPVPLPVRVSHRDYWDAAKSGEAATWRFLRTYVTGYVAACLEASKARKAVAA